MILTLSGQMHSLSAISNRIVFMKKFLPFLLLIFIGSASSSQTATADRSYKSGNYQAAIRGYEKGIKKDSSIALSRHLGDCYMKTRQYEKAESVYKGIVTRKESNTKDLFNYGLVLKCNSNYSLAIVQFETILNTEKDNLTVIEQNNYCKAHLAVQGSASFFQITSLENINSPENDNSPILVNKSLFYTTASKSNDLYSGSAMESVSVIVKKELSRSASGMPVFNKNKILLNKLNPDGNNGVASYSDSTHTLFFTHVDKTGFVSDTGALTRPGIYFSVLKNNKWSDPLPFSWNDPHYSFQHPAISANGKYLVFSSDKPGGFGKADLYASEWKEGAWSKPVNLGEHINTSENEVFPSLTSPGILYFSSDGRVGSGGLDIFRSLSKNGKWSFATNVGSPLNSGRDDFGICVFPGDSTGLISTNRQGGAGGDDIYFFKRIRKYSSMKGYVFLDKKLNAPAANRVCSLYDQDGNKVDETTTDEQGWFQFFLLNPDCSYTVEMDEVDADGLHKAYLTDSERRKIAIASILKNRKRFKSLPPDLTHLKELEEEDPSFYLGLMLLANNTSATPQAGVKINLVNTYGKVVQSTTTNTFGAFAFSHITQNDSFRIALENEKDALLGGGNFILTNLNGEKVQSSFKGNDGHFSFDFTGKNSSRKMTAKVEPSKLYKNFTGILSNESNKPIGHTRITLQNESGSMKQDCMTDDKGKFTFSRLPVDDNYFMSLDENDATLANSAKKVIITDLLGNKILEIELFRLLKERFKIIPADQSGMTELEVDDPWLTMLQKKKTEQSGTDTVTIRENLSYPVNEWKATPETKLILNKVLQVMKANPGLKIEISSHTDSRGSDQYNLSLSIKRANAAMEYLLQNGIKANRLKAIGYGEQRPLNRCLNGVDCSDEEYAQNRRTEFKILY
jgi:outer membrane protein OmpA-like peptidoglycan-associated protein